MAKFCGPIGFGIPTEEHGVYTDTIVERTYTGDLLKDYTKLQGSGGVNDDIIITDKISFIADPYSTDHFQNIRYVKLYNSYWKVTSASYLFPRVIITTGGVYNGQRQTT